MKTKSIWLIALLSLCMASMNLNAQTYDKLWKEVEKAQQSSLPKTAIKHLDDIYRKAKKEKNSPQMLKAYTARSTYQQSITPDSFYTDLKGLEQWAQTTPNHADCAVLHTLIARIYSDYAFHNMWELRQRTDVDDVAPEDIREWSANQFVQKVMDHTHAALEEPQSLVGLSTKKYIPFVVQHNESRYFRHSMYHLLASYGITSLSQMTSLGEDSVITKNIAGIYTDLNKVYKQQGNKEALLLIALEELNWQKNTWKIGDSSFLSALDKLIAENNTYDVCAEIYLAKAEALRWQDRKAEAFRVCEEAIAKYPKYARINALKEIKQDILSPNLYVTVPSSVYPSDSLTLSILHGNIDGFTVHYYKVELPVHSNLLNGNYNDEFIREHTQKVSSVHVPLTRPADYQSDRITYSVAAPQVGLYLMQIVPDAKGAQITSQLVSVTRLKMLSHKLPNNRYEVAVLDYKTGQPVPDAAVCMYSSSRGERTQILSVTTNTNGRAEFDWSKEYSYITAQKGNDNATLLQGMTQENYYFTEDKVGRQRVKLLTDRSLYRPGQTVYVKGIVYSQLSDTANVVAGVTGTLTLVDPNRREVGKAEVRTNEFGSFTTSFTLPAGGLNGDYMLKMDQLGNAMVRVEEYKRPTFELTFDKLDGTYKLGDSVEVKGQAKTFSGVPVQDTSVQYTITRMLNPWWRWFYGTPSLIDSGTVPLDDAGGFTVPVSLKSEGKQADDTGYYIYTITATVTNASGETQSSNTTIAAGSRSLLLRANLPKLMNKDDELELIFKATNLDNQPISVEGEYMLYPFTDEDNKIAAKDPVYTGKFTSNVLTKLPEWKTIPSGAYKLVMKAVDEQGREAGFEGKTTLFSINDKRPVTKSDVWFHPINLDFDADHPAEFIFGTSRKDAYVLMDVFSGNKRLECSLLHLTDSVVHFTYPYKEAYGNGLNISFCFVKEGNAYTQNVPVKKRLADKELQLSWSVFRDKLRPGQKEEWKLTVKDPSGLPANAELLATMYDASLDKIWKNNQLWNIGYYVNIPTVNWRFYYPGHNYYSFWFERENLDVPAMLFDRFWNSPSSQNGVSRAGELDEVIAMGYGSPRKMKMASVVEEMEEIAEAADMSVEDEKTLPEATESLRTNFNETAFFYPQLRTNAKGEVVITFTMPESLTRWNFNGYAHTKGMLTGMLTGETVTSKEFMLTPNLPRFVRVGDNTSVAASVANLTGKAVSGTVVFTLFDPMTEKVISTQKQKFSVEAGKTTGISFAFTATDKYDLLGCRLVAEGGKFSDGEQHLLPVLSNKERVLETIAMPIRGNQTREFSLEGLFNKNSETATGRSLTVEFSGNPVWYAVQALPSLSLPVTDNTVSWATAYYANALASHIMNSKPRLKTVFDAWKKQGGTKETFMSNLQKNQDVKNILLEESPWVMEATSEQDSKERIATLFDLNNIQNNNITALTKLKDLQLHDGSWTWYKGMSGSRHITNFVVQTLVRLSDLTGQPLEGDVLAMRNAAFRYLHQQALAEYKELRQTEKKGVKIEGISDNALQYLYLVSVSGERVPAENKTAYNYFLDKIKETIAKQSITQKAIAAVILQKNKRTSDAQSFIASLKEHTTQTDELGMFFAFNEDPYTWSGLKIPAHVYVMEAFDVAAKDMNAIEEMKLWLLKQKQTQQWDSPVATVNAVYALLYRGSSLVENQGDVRISLGGKTIETLAPAATAAVPGIAYVKETITDKKILDKANTAVVEKRDAGIAWGAVYAQYEENLDKITTYGEGLNVDKKLYIEKVSGSKKELIPIAAGTKLTVGDKVISRITIKLDRSMDFVQLKDQRGACFEPIGNLSGYIWNSGTGYYVAVKDASTNFYFDSLKKGVYVLEHGYYVTRAGVYESGLATIQSAYAPEYAAHAASVKVNVNNK